MTETPTPAMERLAVAVLALVNELPDGRRHELATLATLSDDVADTVVSVRYRVDVDAFDVLWMDRVIGVVSRQWLLTGEVPEDFGPEVDGRLP